MSETIHHIRRAIIMAAGKGERMRPATLNTPKPLISVRGTPMIESVINALHLNGINEIHVVTGYLKEQFAYLPEKYPGLTLIENPYYDTCNNISSLYMAKDYLSECIILDGDQIIYNPAILSADFTLSGYSCVYTEGHTDEWLMKTENGIVTSCSRTGGSHGWQLYSVSRWTEEDGEKLKNHLIEEFDHKQNRQIYWDDVAMFCHPEDYRLGIYPMSKEDIIEIDSFEELVCIDASYAENKEGK
ncbi:MAG: phosphocholine cytidylyltransferase family protein [Erysipelotrichaceae bacterium]|nr:phosphocholine cytidylyltransferase family protein [Erysipelotrichaceae bacterium]